MLTGAYFNGDFMSRTDEFLDLYKQLEETACTVYNLPEDGSAIRRLSQMKLFSDIRGDLALCRDVRNLVQHRRKIGGEYAVEPGEEMVALLRRTIKRVKNPITLKKIAVEMKKALWKRPDDLVMQTLVQMEERGFTYVPILENGIVTGVFSQNTYVSYLLKNNNCTDTALRFRDIAEFTRIDDRGHEIFIFLRAGMFASEAEKLCEEAYRNKKRIGMIFLTPNGDSNERVKAVLTPWNILGSGS